MCLLYLYNRPFIKEFEWIIYHICWQICPLQIRIVLFLNKTNQFISSFIILKNPIYLFSVYISYESLAPTLF